MNILGKVGDYDVYGSGPKTIAHRGVLRKERANGGQRAPCGGELVKTPPICISQNMGENSANMKGQRDARIASSQDESLSRRNEVVVESLDATMARGWRHIKESSEAAESLKTQSKVEGEGRQGKVDEEE